MGASIGFDYRTWGNSWGNSWLNTWGKAPPTTGGAVKVYPPKKDKEYPEDFMAFIFKRGLVKEEEKKALEISQVIPEVKEEFKEVQEEYFEFIDLIEAIPEYETEIREEQEEKYLKEVRDDISRITRKIEETSISIEFIIALLASDLDELEVALVIAQSL